MSTPSERLLRPAADTSRGLIPSAGRNVQRGLIADPQGAFLRLRIISAVMFVVEAITRLRPAGQPARVLILTTYDTDRDVLPAIDAGATGYLLKDAPREELLRAVRAAHAGQAVLAPSVAGALMSRAGGRTNEALSPREVEVLRQEIGSELSPLARAPGNAQRVSQPRNRRSERRVVIWGSVTEARAR